MDDIIAMDAHIWLQLSIGNRSEKVSKKI